MMAEYEFIEVSSRTTSVDGEPMRLVSFRGKDYTTIPETVLNVDGSFVMPVMDYFMAGAEGRLSEVIRDHVIERLTAEGDK